MGFEAVLMTGPQALSNRSQFVTYNGVKFNLNNVKSGVPQGSIRGPLLFLLYINDLSFACKRTFPVLFADDSNLFLSGKNTDQVQQMINDEIKRYCYLAKSK